MGGRIGRWGLRAVAVAALAANVTTTFLAPRPSPDHGLLDVLTLLLGTGAIVEFFFSRLMPRPGPDRIVVSTDDYTKMVATSAVAAKASMSEQNDGGGGCVSRSA